MLLVLLFWFGRVDANFNQNGSEPRRDSIVEMAMLAVAGIYTLESKLWETDGSLLPFAIGHRSHWQSASLKC
jgi:hypothetical protein